MDDYDRENKTAKLQSFSHNNCSDFVEKTCLNLTTIHQKFASKFSQNISFAFSKF